MKTTFNNVGLPFKTADCNGTPLKIGDVVRYRKYDEYNFVGIVKSELYYIIDLCYIDIEDMNIGIIKKYPTNLKKMSDEEAMLWKLEN